MYGQGCGSRFRSHAGFVYLSIYQASIGATYSVPVLGWVKHHLLVQFVGPFGVVWGGRHTRRIPGPSTSLRQLLFCLTSGGSSYHCFGESSVDTLCRRKPAIAGIERVPLRHQQ